MFFAIILGANLFAQNVNIDKYITLDVTSGEKIVLKFAASVENTGVKVVSGSWDTTLLADKYWSGLDYYTAGASTMTIYGDVTCFDCSYNGIHLTNIDLSHNKNLVILYCYKNALTDLDVTGLTSLERLNCHENQLTLLDVSSCTSLKELICDRNQLTSLYVTGLASLTTLDCSINELTCLDVSSCTSLQELYCSENQLTSLDVSSLTSLRILCLLDNNFTAQALDEIYCALPQRKYLDEAKIIVSTSVDNPVVLTTNKSNATSKNWAVKCFNPDEYYEYIFFDFPATTGNYVCGSD